MIKDLKRKFLNGNTVKYNVKWYIEEFFTIRKNLRDELNNNGPDVPSFANAQYLGDGTPTNQWNIPVYKLNVPGYFYRLPKDTIDSSSTVSDSGVLLASNPSALTSPGSRLMYLVCSPNNAANNMCVIPAGASTYAAFPGIGDHFFYVPTIYGASTGLHQSQYALQVGEIPNTDVSGAAYNAHASIFSGNWLDRNNYVTVCGFFFMKPSKAMFVGNYKTEKYLPNMAQLIREYCSKSGDIYPEEDVDSVVDYYMNKLQES